MTLLSDLFIHKRRSCAYGETIETVRAWRILAVVTVAAGIVALRWLS